ncbi:MAG: hypothetical protein IKK55_00295 [Clostridia bacterium]|nr:hypothetical protein [Clostridia bacterium]
MIKAVCFNGDVKQLDFIVEEVEGIKKVSIPKTLYSKDVKFIDFDFFGAVAHEGDEGYLIIPGNEGYICYFKNHEDNEYVLNRYTMPIFAVNKGRKAFLAIVTGMPYNYDLVYGRKDGDYYIYPRFKIDGDELYEDIKVEYYELNDNDANYSGIARFYRNFQLSRGECIPLRQRAEERPQLGYARDSIMIRIRLGWKPAPPQILHQTLENEPEMITACSFKDVEKIIDALQLEGIDKAEICLVGWNTKGHDGRWPQCFPVAEELGGEEALRQLIKKVQKIGYQIVCHTNSTDTYEISEMWNEADLLLDKQGEKPEDAPWSGGKMYHICPDIAYKQAQKILPAVADLGFKGIHYIDVLNIVMPRKCYNENHPLNIKESINVSRELMKLTREIFGGYSSEGGYDFGAKYLDFALNLDYGAGKGKPFFDEYIPLWQLVYHGIILSNPSMAETMNFSLKDSKNPKLKLIEYGGRPTYYYYSVFRDDWQASADKDLVCGTKSQLEKGIKAIKEGYELYKELSYLQNFFMEEHEKVAQGVYSVRYSDNTVITVDYNSQTYFVNKQEKTTD